jgi:hypothetical protein
MLAEIKNFILCKNVKRPKFLCISKTTFVYTTCSFFTNTVNVLEFSSGQWPITALEMTIHSQCYVPTFQNDNLPLHSELHICTSDNAQLRFDRSSVSSNLA